MVDFIHLFQKEFTVQMAKKLTRSPHGSMTNAPNTEYVVCFTSVIKTIIAASHCIPS